MSITAVREVVNAVSDFIAPKTATTDAGYTQETIQETIAVSEKNMEKAEKILLDDNPKNDSAALLLMISTFNQNNKIVMQTLSYVLSTNSRNSLLTFAVSILFLLAYLLLALGGA